MWFLNQLLILGQTQTGLVITLLAITVLLMLRRFLPAEQRGRVKVPLFFLGLAIVLGLSATVAFQLSAYTIWGLLSFFDLLSLIVGVTSLLSLVVFDLTLNRKRVRVPALVRNLIHVSIVLLIVITILYQREFDPLSLLTTSAVLTAVVGLALQNTIANMFAGLALQIDRTFGLGDWVQVGEHVGRISEIKWRSTLLWTEDGDLLVVPNGHLLDAAVMNLSQPDNIQRLEANVGFHYRHPPNEVKRVLVEAVRGVPGVLQEPAPDCILVDFADSAVAYKVRYWISDYTYHTAIESEVRTRIWYAARRAELEIPFPIRTLVMPSLAASGAAASQRDGVVDHLSVVPQIGLFTMLDQQAQATLAAGIRTVEFGAGENIIEENNPSGALHIIRSGEVSVYFSTGDQRHEVTTLKPGEVFCLFVSMTGESRPARYAAKCDTSCYVVDCAILAQLLVTYPKLAEDLSTMLAAREMALDDKVKAHSAETQARHAAETKSRLLARMQQVFRIG